MCLFGEYCICMGVKTSGINQTICVPVPYQNRFDPKSTIPAWFWLLWHVYRQFSCWPFNTIIPYRLKYRHCLGLGHETMMMIFLNRNTTKNISTVRPQIEINLCKLAPLLSNRISVIHGSRINYETICCPQFCTYSYQILCHVGGTSPPTWHNIW